jgi:DNA repair exonuclease SbcCD nuclease subunit
MKLCILGDTHFGARGDSLDFHNYFKKFYDEIFFPYLKANDIEVIFQLGDLFDRRKYINFNTLHLCREYFFDRCEILGIKVHTLLGNHDVAFKNTLEVNSTGLLLNEYRCVEYYDSFETVIFDGVDIDVVPWICGENEVEIFQKMKESKSQICFGHFDIAGFQMERGMISETGVDKKLFSRYDMVLSGHFHHKSTDGQITYTGTPYEMTWSDYNDPKGFHIFDTDTRELQFVENQFHMFNKVMYDDKIHDFEYWKTYDFDSLKDSYVKVVVLNKQNPYLFDTVLDTLYKKGIADISIVEDFSDIVFDQDQELIDQAEDTMTILSKYIDNLSLNVENEKLKSLMRELYVEALNSEMIE